MMIWECDFPVTVSTVCEGDERSVEALKGGFNGVHVGHGHLGCEDAQSLVWKPIHTQTEHADRHKVRVPHSEFIFLLWNFKATR